MKSIYESRQNRTSIFGLAIALLFICGAVQTADAQWTTGTNINNTNTGNVGIGTGTTTPTATLTVQGNSSDPSLTADTGVANLKSSSTVELSFGGQAAAPYSFWIQTKRSPNDGYSYPLIFNPLGGNVGIGTTNPSSGKLQIQGNANAWSQWVQASTTTSQSFGARIQAGTNSSDASFHILNASGGSDLFYVRGDGNIGVGTTSPSSKLAVVGGDVAIGEDSVSTLGGNITTFGVKGRSTSRAGGLRLRSSDNSLDGSFYGADGAWYLGSISNHPLLFTTNNTEQVRIAANGNVGIGTTDLTGFKLNINGNTNVIGNINLAGTINAKYQDVAEWVPSSEQLSAGTVVVLDSTKSNQVTSSSVSYDTRVAGVVSEQPGIALGEKSENKVLVATTGRVRVKVDASKGPIHIGDLLVTSDIPGVAMKSEPVELAGRKMHMPGTLIGKALEPLEKGQGEILALLSLQ